MRRVFKELLEIHFLLFLCKEEKYISSLWPLVCLLSPISFLFPFSISDYSLYHIPWKLLKRWTTTAANFHLYIKKMNISRDPWGCLWDLIYPIYMLKGCLFLNVLWCHGSHGCLLSFRYVLLRCPEVSDPLSGSKSIVSKTQRAGGRVRL